MLEKRNKGKAKREAKEAKRLAKHAAGVKVIMPAPGVNPSIHPSVLAPAFNPNRENADALNQIAVALTRLRIHAGDDEDMALIYSRLMFGRRLAHFYFDDIIAENLHHAIQTIVLTVKDQYVAGQEKQVMSLDGVAGEEISEAIHMVEELASKMDPTTYLMEIVLHDHEVKGIDAELHLQTWEEYLAKNPPVTK